MTVFGVTRIHRKIWRGDALGWLSMNVFPSTSPVSFRMQFLVACQRSSRRLRHWSWRFPGTMGGERRRMPSRPYKVSGALVCHLTQSRRKRNGMYCFGVFFWYRPWFPSAWQWSQVCVLHCGVWTGGKIFQMPRLSSASTMAFVFQECLAMICCKIKWDNGNLAKTESILLLCQVGDKQFSFAHAWFGFQCWRICRRVFAQDTQYTSARKESDTDRTEIICPFEPFSCFLRLSRFCWKSLQKFSTPIVDIIKSSHVFVSVCFYEVQTHAMSARHSSNYLSSHEPQTMCSVPTPCTPHGMQTRRVHIPTHTYTQTHTHTHIYIYIIFLQIGLTYARVQMCVDVVAPSCQCVAFPGLKNMSICVCQCLPRVFDKIKVW